MIQTAAAHLAASLLSAAPVTSAREPPPPVLLKAVKVSLVYDAGGLKEVTPQMATCLYDTPTGGGCSGGPSHASQVEVVFSPVADAAALGDARVDLEVRFTGGEAVRRSHLLAEYLSGGRLELPPVRVETAAFGLLHVKATLSGSAVRRKQSLTRKVGHFATR
jgi:hypothetical protein